MIRKDAHQYTSFITDGDSPHILAIFVDEGMAHIWELATKHMTKCPRCGAPMLASQQKLSLKDNSTKVCQRCGSLEKVEKITGLEWEGDPYWDVAYVPCEQCKLFRDPNCNKDNCNALHSGEEPSLLREEEDDLA